MKLLGLSPALYVLYGVKYIDLVSLVTHTPVGNKSTMDQMGHFFVTEPGFETWLCYRTWLRDVALLGPLGPGTKGAQGSGSKNTSRIQMLRQVGFYCVIDWRCRIP